MGAERFDPATLTKAAEDTLTVRRVFGESYVRDGALVIPVARVTGMTGLGSGGGEGGGGGWGLHVKPLGVYVVDATGVRWRATYDVNRIVLGAELVAAWGLAVGFAAWAMARRR